VPFPFTILAREAGLRLDAFLADKEVRFSRAQWQEFIEQGHVSRNGVADKPGARLRQGDTVSFTEPVLPAAHPIAAAAEDIPLDVLFEDTDLIVVNKAPGLVVHPAAGHWEGTLVNALLHHCKDLSGIGGALRPGIVHRLDKETSGCIVAAKNDQAHHALVRFFSSRQVQKTYVALVQGHLAEKEGVIEERVGRHPIHRQRMAVTEKGRMAKTGYRVRGTIGLMTLVECNLFTGRTHQIRVHLKHIGHPLCGDALYGKRGEFSRQMLHAWKLGFAHPRTGEALHFIAPLPADFPPETPALLQ